MDPVDNLMEERRSAESTETIPAVSTPPVYGAEQAQNPHSHGNSEQDKQNSKDQDEDEDNGAALHEMLTRTRSGGQSSQLCPEVASRVRSLARTLSTRRLSDGPLEADTDEDGFNAERILKSFVHEAHQQGIDFRKTGVVMEDVTASGTDSSALEGHTFGDLLCLPLTVYRAVKAMRHRKMRKIIRDVNALAKPGEMVLVLGRPGSGCSSFLRTTAGVTDQFAGGVAGEISYDGIPQHTMMRHYRSDVIYNGELDVHFPYLTVRQTLDFAIACKTPAVRVNGVSRKEYISATRDLYATIFGLTQIYDTNVGDEFVRGVSGGQRKRVSIAEALAARGTVYCWDNATRGLDASTALEYAQAIRIMTNLLHSTAFVTIYQASENIYETFDKVTVLHTGRQIYYGSASAAKAYFERMGYECPPRQATAEFLTALTDPHGLHRVRSGYEGKVPRTADELEAYWRASPEFAALKNDIEEYKSAVNGEATEQFFSESMRAEKSKYARNKSYYTVSFPEQVRLCTIRGFQRVYGNRSYTVINVAAAVVQAFITGSAFYNSPSSTNGAFSRGGVLYFALLYYSLMGLANITFDHRPILQKHKTYSLYHPGAEALGSTLSGAPFRMIGLTCFLIILFFLSNLNRTAGSFFRIYFFLSLCSESIYSLFEFIAAACDNISQANSIAGIVMFSISMYSTYMIQYPNMHPWFQWISYVLPVRYAFEGMLEAEFHGRHMDCGGTLVPSGAGYENVANENRVCAFMGSQKGQSWVLGDDYLKSQYGYKYWHMWRNWGIMFIFLVGYIVVKAVITEIKRPVKGGGDALIFKKGTRRAAAKEPGPGDLEALDQMKLQGDAREKFSSGSDLMRGDATDAGAVDSSDEVFEGFQSKGIFIWREVCYTIPYMGSERVLLDHVTGYVAPGTMTALMGESGAGKTTLLNTLAQRNDIGVVTGDMLVNGHPIDTSFERRTGYVQQQDIHIAEMTVRESLVFSARLRRPQSVPDEEKLHSVENVIRLLDMEEYSEALVGALGCGLNVEQRKKLSIGVELVAKPDLLLFLDEPTSGLDSQSSWAIVQLLRKLARSGQCILCTIHQPSATLFERFDRLLLLRKGGQTVYFGDIGDNSSTVLSYFEGNGARKCEQSENPAEYILEVIGAGATATIEEDWHEVWQNSSERRETDEHVTQWIQELSSQAQEKSEIGEKPSKYATSYLYQFKYVWWRTTTMFWRDMPYLMSKMMLQVVSGLYIGWTFFNPGKSFTGLQDTLFAAFMSVIVSAPTMNQIQARALSSRESFEVRESKSNMFHWSLLLITQYLAEIPYQLLFSTMFFVAFYFPLRVFFEASRSAVFYLNYCIMFQLYYVALGLMILYMSPNLPSANVLMGLVLSMLIQFCGVTQPMSLMPGFWTFMWKASPYTYFIQNMVAIVLHKKPVVCKKKELSYFDPPQGKTCGQYMENFLKRSPGYISNPNATSNCAYCQVSVGDEYLAQRNVSYGNLWRNFGFYWAYIVFNIFAMVGIYYIFSVRGVGGFNPFAIVKRLIKRK
ncbi:ZYBA0S03-07778g1_1 [Zygosaccharomyces bailii CLIB 213]|uniref:ZYBA0S03-07778g1_1 n=1 Tax=Zygosaccharomyces bailii (strain CLIB 213 / ATCC 58445 / CBS 680 / BCRC 21525 / NBRC 1098 / NCYC 1416 / NRRL Y-2227) TaxID=1333698 RepID=A0A8J2XA11_ZYGB2|nr:ZYBA0S03-07778g1_1 [Zygosaccharomyces bailii CLIB 213]